jgi:hypothetical protein
MKFTIVLSLLFLCVADVPLASEVLTIPPFEKADVHMAADRSSAEPSVQNLRAILEDGDLNDQLAAGAALVKIGDEKSIARLVYAVRQGSPDAAEILLNHPSINVVPLLVEDIAHGDMSPIVEGSGDWSHGHGSVRNMAFKIVARTLAGQTALPERTRAWFNELLVQSVKQTVIY